MLRIQIDIEGRGVVDQREDTLSNEDIEECFQVVHAGSLSLPVFSHLLVPVVLSRVPKEDVRREPQTPKQDRNRAYPHPGSNFCLFVLFRLDESQDQNDSVWSDEGKTPHRINPRVVSLAPRTLAKQEQQNIACKQCNERVHEHLCRWRVLVT